MSVFGAIVARGQGYQDIAGYYPALDDGPPSVR